MKLLSKPGLFGVLSTSVSLHFIHSLSLSFLFPPLTLFILSLSLSTFLLTERESLSSSPAYSHLPFYEKLDSYHHHLDPLGFLEVTIIIVVVDLSSLLIHVLFSSPSLSSLSILSLSFYSSSLSFFFFPSTTISHLISSQLIPKWIDATKQRFPI